MFLILRTTDWKEEDYINHNIVPYGWCEDNDRALPNNEEIIAKVQTKEQMNFLLEKLNNKKGLAEGRKEGYEQGKNNERESQCGKKTMRKI